LIAIAGRAQQNARNSRFAPGPSLIRVLDAVVDGIANNMQQRLKQHLDDGLVGFGVLAFHLKLDGLTEICGHFAQDPRKALKDGT